MSKKLAFIQLHFSAFLFGLTGVFGALIETSADVLVLGRLLIAFSALTCYFLVRQQFPHLNVKTFLAQCLLGSLLTLHWVTFYIAIKVGGVALGTLGFASFPAFVCLFERIFFKEKLKAKEYWLLTAISFGLILITPEFEFGNQSTQGLLWGILSGAIYGLLAVANRKTATKLTGAQASWWQYLIGSLLLLPISGQLLPTVSASDWFWIACLGLLCTSLAYTIFISSLNQLSARTAAMIISLEPVYAIVVAWLCLGEQPSLRMILGCCLIVGAVLKVNGEH